MNPKIAQAGIPSGPTKLSLVKAPLSGATK